MRDVAILLESLTSVDYLAGVLSKTRGLAAPAAVTRSRLVVPHVRVALEYLEQGLAGPTRVAFLPLYYALLNFAKVYILLGQHHALLPVNRWHGAQYQGFAKASHSLLTEDVIIKKGGAIPLLYRTLTGVTISSDVSVRLGEMYSYMFDVGAEYTLATGEGSRLAGIAMALAVSPTGLVPTVHVYRPGQTVARAEVKLLVGWTKDPTKPNHFISAPEPAGTTDFAGIRDRFRPFLLYLGREYYCTPLSSRHLLLPEELPILIALFHMSSVVRYKPEFLAKLTDSKYWPMLLAAQRHSVFKFLTLTWSYVHNETLSYVHA